MNETTKNSFQFIVPSSISNVMEYHETFRYDNVLWLNDRRYHRWIHGDDKPHCIEYISYTGNYGDSLHPSLTRLFHRSIRIERTGIHDSYPMGYHRVRIKRRSNRRERRRLRLLLLAFEQEKNTITAKKLKTFSAHLKRR